MAANRKYIFLLNLAFLGFTTFLYLFEIARGKDNPLEDVYVDNSKNVSIEKLKVEEKKNIFLTVEIYADEQYDYDQNIYLAKGNVKALLNGWILRSDLLSYDKSSGILTSKGNIRFSKGGQYFICKEFKYNMYIKCRGREKVLMTPLVFE